MVLRSFALPAMEVCFVFDRCLLSTPPCSFATIFLLHEQAQLFLLSDTVHSDGEVTMSNAMKVIGIGALLFLVAFAIATGRWWRDWQAQLKIEPACSYNLKALWVVARLCSVKDKTPFPPPLPFIQRFWVDAGREVLLTPDMQKFLELPALFKGTYWDFRGILLCARDPDYLLKMAKMEQGLPYEPSYRWLPDARTLAECPYCRLAISLDGKLERRGTAKP